jgi:hypothetical protein
MREFYASFRERQPGAANRVGACLSQIPKLQARHAISRAFSHRSPHGFHRLTQIIPEHVSLGTMESPVRRMSSQFEHGEAICLRSECEPFGFRLCALR